jgi:hypothetical protein
LGTGTASIQAALAVLGYGCAELVGVLLVLIAFTTAFMVAPLFAGMVLVYLALTTANTFPKRARCSSTSSVIGGAAAISVPVSEWLLASPEEVPPDAVVPPDVLPVPVGVVTELPLEEVEPGCRSFQTTRFRSRCRSERCLRKRRCCPTAAGSGGAAR